jgi:hypothetical protein
LPSTLQALPLPISTRPVSWVKPVSAQSAIKTMGFPASMTAGAGFVAYLYAIDAQNNNDVTNFRVEFSDSGSSSLPGAVLIYTSSNRYRIFWNTTLAGSVTLRVFALVGPSSFKVCNSPHTFSVNPAATYPRNCLVTGATNAAFDESTSSLVIQARDVFGNNQAVGVTNTFRLTRTLASELQLEPPPL